MLDHEILWLLPKLCNSSQQERLDQNGKMLEIQNLPELEKFVNYYNIGFVN
jgi:hypothetical protein